MNRMIRFGVLAMVSTTGVGSVSAATLACSAATTLDGLATCIRGQMPGSGSDGFVAPTTSEQADWRLVVNQMLSGSCGFALPSSLASIMQLRTFTDSASGKSYCLLMEVLDANGNGVVDRGWGTFMVNPAAVREISHQAAHPISDSTTENQAIGIFGGTDSRSYLMAGAHRSANSGSSVCQSSYAPADAAHNVDNMFHATNAELMAFYGATPWQAIQWHGMSADTCQPAEAYLSHGLAVAPMPGDKNLELKNRMLDHHPTWDLEVPGTGACTLNATDNTQGRLINGVAAGSVCGTAASSYTGRFLHIEQDPGFRSPADWIPAVSDTWLAGAPAAPANLAASAGDTQVSLAWTASPGADSYAVHRSTTSGGPYATIQSNLTGTSFTNTGLTNGTTYYYVVTATNAAGESPSSNQASATPVAGPVTLTFTSVAAEDGWVLESGETTNVGGSINATAATTSALRVGDDGNNNQNRQYKAVVSFVTASIPDGATIVSATLRLRRGSLSGTNPFTTHGTCLVDVQTGGFSGATMLQTSDFQAAATAVQAASLSNPASNGAWSEGSLNAAGLAALNKTGTTQFRVYFSLDDNDDLGNDYIGYYSGDDANAANRPQLVVTYR